MSIICLYSKKKTTENNMCYSTQINIMYLLLTEFPTLIEIKRIFFITV